MRNLILLCLIVLLYACRNLSHRNAFDGYHGQPLKVERTYRECLTRDSTVCYPLNTVHVDSFDRRGRKLVTHTLDSTTKQIKFERRFTYDRKGQLTEEAIRAIGEVPRERKTYAYNRYGLITYEATTGRYRNFSREGIFDPRARTMLYLVRNREGKVTGQRKLFYDAQWRNTRLIDMDSLGEPYRRQDFDYDPQGNQTEIRWYWDAEEVYKWVTKSYDAQNNLNQEQVFSLEKGDTVLSSSKEYEYKFDAHFNWTERRTYENGNLEWLIHRKFYYSN